MSAAMVAACFVHLRYRKVDVRPPGKGNSYAHGARPVRLIISMVEWIRTSRWSMKNSLSMYASRCSWSVPRLKGDLPLWSTTLPYTVERVSTLTLPPLLSVVERMWHTQDSHGQNLALAVLYVPHSLGEGGCRTNMAHIRQSGPDYGLDFQVKALQIFQVIASPCMRCCLWSLLSR